LRKDCRGFGIVAAHLEEDGWDTRRGGDSKMKALLLAAGEGTRLRPLTLDRPKPMLPLGGRPMLEYLVVLLQAHGVTEIAINLHYKPDAIVEYFGDGQRFGVSITYSPEPRLLGSAGAAKHLDWFFDGKPFLVMYGDVLANVDLGELIKAHRARRAAGTLVLYQVEDPTRCGMVELAPDGRITRFVEKPSRLEVRSDLANAGIYLLEPEILDFVPRGGKSDFGRDVFPAALQAGVHLFGMDLGGYLLDIGSPERYAQAQVDLLTGRFQSSPYAVSIGGASHVC
jgi:NDP-sugar pyrophosphorylase family protein